MTILFPQRGEQRREYSKGAAPLQGWCPAESEDVPKLFFDKTKQGVEDVKTWF
jgi:hypothetical protein